MKSILYLLITLLMSIATLSGCGIDTKRIQTRHWELNDTIRETHFEQLLLNIVRLRYDEMPFFLQVSSVSTQFSTNQNFNVSGSFPEKAPNIFGVGGGASYTESPIVTWSLPDSREQLGRLMAPMGADQLTVLGNSGWNPERVLRVGVKKMNRLRNKDFRIREGILIPDSYLEFIEALKLFNELERDGQIDFAYGIKSSMGAGKIPLEKLDTRAISEGMPYGLQFMTRDDPNMFEPLKLFKPLFVRFSKQSDTDLRAQRLRQLLNLDPQKYSFGIVDTVNSGTEQLLSESGKVTQVFDPDRKMAEIVLNNRSMMEVLYMASSYVKVPAEDFANQIANDKRDSFETDWLDIRVAKDEPSDTWLKVNYHGRWFYIALQDVKSRASFTLLDALFASVVGDVPGAKPLLTLPVAR